MRVLYHPESKTLFVSAMTLNFNELLKVTKAVSLADEPDIKIEFGIFPIADVLIDGELTEEDAKRILNYIEEPGVFMSEDQNEIEGGDITKLTKVKID